MSVTGSDSVWRSKPWRRHPTRVDRRFPQTKEYSGYEDRSGVIPWERLPRAFQNAVAWPPIRQLGNKGAGVAYWIPEFEYKLLQSLCARARAVYNLYVLQKKSARKIADTYGWGFLSQHDIYILAGRLKRIIDGHYSENTTFDWDLAWMLAEEGASDQEIIEIIKCKPETYRIKTLRTGRRRSKAKTLSEAQVRQIKKRLARGDAASDIALEAGVWPSTIHSIKRGKWHKDVVL